MFAEKSEVSYKGTCGEIKFICSSYVVIALTPAKGRQSPYVIVFPSDYSKIKVFKDSEK
jgi:hypothetical protein